MSARPTPRVLIPSLLAGPAVVFFSLAYAWACAIPHTIEIELGHVSLWAFISLMSLVVGTPVALVATTLGSYALIEVGARWPLLRFPFVWPLAGGAATWFVVRSLEIDPAAAFAFTAAGAFCAFLCRIRLRP